MGVYAWKVGPHKVTVQASTLYQAALAAFAKLIRQGDIDRQPRWDRDNNCWVGVDLISPQLRRVSVPEPDFDPSIYRTKPERSPDPSNEMRVTEARRSEPLEQLPWDDRTRFRRKPIRKQPAPPVGFKTKCSNRRRAQERKRRRMLDEAALHLLAAQEAKAANKIIPLRRRKSS